jgi:hypothetical protein
LEAGIVLEPALQGCQQFNANPTKDQGNRQPDQEGTNTDRERDQGKQDGKGDHKGANGGANG